MLNWRISNIVNETPAAFWAIVELNLWVVVASIPSLRPLITKTLRERRERSHAKSYQNSSSRTKTSKPRLWFSSTGTSSAHSHDRLPPDGERLKPVNPSPASVHDYNVHVSTTKTPRKSAWTPLEISENGHENVQLQEWGGIRVDREIEISHPENVFHRGVWHDSARRFIQPQDGKYVLIGTWKLGKILVVMVDCWLE